MSYWGNDPNGVVVLVGNWLRGSYPMGELSYRVVAPVVVVPRVVVPEVVVLSPKIGITEMHFDIAVTVCMVVSAR